MSGSFSSIVAVNDHVREENIAPAMRFINSIR